MRNMEEKLRGNAVKCPPGDKLFKTTIVSAEYLLAHEKRAV